MDDTLNRIKHCIPHVKGLMDHGKGLVLNTVLGRFDDPVVPEIIIPLKVFANTFSKDEALYVFKLYPKSAFYRFGIYMDGVRVAAFYDPEEDMKLPKRMEDLIDEYKSREGVSESKESDTSSVL